MRFRSLVVVLLLGLSLSAMVVAQDVGPFANKVVYDVRMQEEIALQDVAAGNIDIFQWSTSGNVIFGLDQATLDELDLYIAPTGSESLFLNPYPDAAPYIATANDGTVSFNPFAIQEVRYALHWLINRQQIIDEIMQGTSEPAIPSVAPSQAGGFKLNLVAAKLGITAEGDEALGIQMITDAMEAAAALPENAGRLVRGADGFWEFDGADIVIIIAIRVDDPNVRLPMGRYVADQLEKAGLKVQRDERDRVYCIRTVYLTDPADMLWHMYTEGWGAGGTNAWQEVSITQMFAPWYTNMPGIGEGSWWNFESPEIDALTQDIIYGKFFTLDEYWDKMLRSTEIGLTDAVRIYLQYDNSYFAVNKDAFEARFLYGLGDGINDFSLYTMRPVAEDGVVRITQFSAQGALFLNAWDPVGTQGFNDFYAANIITPCTDNVGTQMPGSGKDFPILLTWKDVDTQIALDADGNVVGEIVAPAEAVEYDSATGTWVSTGGEMAISQATYNLVPCNWHDGNPMGIWDYIYADGFITDWATEDGAGDLFYDGPYSSAWASGFAYAHGTIYDFANNEITTFFDYNFPPDKDRVGLSGAPSLYVRGANHGQGVEWTVIEALALLVAEGSESGTTYGFTQLEGVSECDVLRVSAVADIVAKLEEMIARKHVPAYLVGYMDDMGLTADDLVGFYENSLAFINAHGHAYISNGGFYIDSFDPANNQITLAANRDPGYPFNGQYWLDLLETNTARIDNVGLPLVATAGDDVTVTVEVSEATYPYNVFEPGTISVVEVILITDAGEMTYTASLTTPGVFEVVIPGADTTGLAAGAYTVVGIATPEGGLPAASSVTLLLQ